MLDLLLGHVRWSFRILYLRASILNFTLQKRVIFCLYNSQYFNIQNVTLTRAFGELLKFQILNEKNSPKSSNQSAVKVVDENETNY